MITTKEELWLDINRLVHLIDYTSELQPDTEVQGKHVNYIKDYALKEARRLMTAAARYIQPPFPL